MSLYLVYLPTHHHHTPPHHKLLRRLRVDGCIIHKFNKSQIMRKFYRQYLIFSPNVACYVLTILKYWDCLQFSTQSYTILFSHAFQVFAVFHIICPVTHASIRWAKLMAQDTQRGHTWTHEYFSTKIARDQIGPGGLRAPPGVVDRSEVGHCFLPSSVQVGNCNSNWTESYKINQFGHFNM